MPTRSPACPLTRSPDRVNRDTKLLDGSFILPDADLQRVLDAYRTNQQIANDESGGIAACRLVLSTASIPRLKESSVINSAPFGETPMRTVFRVTVLVPLIFLSLTRVASGESFVFVSLLEQRQIVTFARDAETGRLERRHVTECPAEPAFTAASSDGRLLFVALRSSGQLAVYRIDAAEGTLSLNNVVAGGDDPAFLMTDRSGKFLLSAYYVSNKVSVHRIAADGRLSEAPEATRATAANAHGIAVDSRNESVYVSHTGANRIDQFHFDGETGQLTPLEPPFIVANPGQNPRHVVLHPNDRWAYCSNEAGGSSEDGASGYLRDPHRKTLTLTQSVSSLPADFDAGQNSTARCLMTPDGKFLYVANRGHNSVAGFAIDSTSGRLNRISVTPTERVPRSFTITQDGQFLYAAGEASGRVAGYRIQKTGELQSLETVASGPVSWAVLAVETQP